MTDEKRPIMDRMRAMRRQELDERRVLLADHTEKFSAIRAEIVAACEAAGGHAYRLLPDNGFNGPHFVTGEWPQACGYCDKRKPPDES